jgi:hypothetical protein
MNIIPPRFCSSGLMYKPPPVVREIGIKYRNLQSA